MTASIRIVRSFACSPQRVFAAWTQPDRLKQWAWGDLGRETGAEMDLRPGGRYEVTTQSKAGPCAFTGTVVEAVPGARLVLTLGWDAPMGYDVGDERLTVELSRTGSGCEMTFVHDGVADAAARAEHERGWQNTFDHLERLVES